MSKAFTREESDGQALPEITPLPSALPPGARNLMTPDGAYRLRAELARLIEVERPAGAVRLLPRDKERRTHCWNFFATSPAAVALLEVGAE